MAGAAAPTTAPSPESTNAEYCAGHGPPAGIRLPSAQAPSASPSASCNGIASQIFQHGFCACHNAIFSGGLITDAMDSGSSEHPVSASVGVNEQFGMSGSADIGGSLIVAGRDGWSTSSGHFHVDGNLETNSNVSLSGIDIVFGRDAWVKGGISASGLVDVNGDLYQPPGTRMPKVTIGGQRFERDFDIPAPCACDENEVLDIKAIVEAGVAQTGAKPGAALQPLARGTVDLDCGRIAAGPSSMAGTTTLKVPGRTALFIDGDLSIAGSFDVDVGTTGELDVFISGNISFAGVGTIGSRERPAAVRFYVGGDKAFTIAGSQVFAGNLYAPFATVTVAGSQELWGSLFVGSYVASGLQAMHYDSAILRVGNEGKACDTPPPPPGRDTPPPPPPPPGCMVDLDCPSPQVCVAGNCEFLGPE
ncbi:MAG TPA: hypothetical protein VJV78_13625 [Polyangiales bacterium]|nr:hypothetical protein [Polyangiales bacterium]